MSSQVVVDGNAGFAITRRDGNPDGAGSGPATCVRVVRQNELEPVSVPLTLSFAPSTLLLRR